MNTHTHTHARALAHCIFPNLRSKQRREAAILLQQVVTSERAIRHAAWGARKEIRARIRAMREEGKMEREGGRECVQAPFQYSNSRRCCGGSTEDTCSIPAGRCSMLLIPLGTEGIMELSVQSENYRSPSQD